MTVFVIFIYLFGATGILLVLMALGKMHETRQFKHQVMKLFDLSKPVPLQSFHEGQLKTLPEPVQRYFRLVLTDGQVLISYARIKHEGLFKTGLKKGWVSIRGEQYATTKKPGFIWKGTTDLFTARDMYIGDQGRLIVSILSLIPIINAKGKSYDQGELLRWLGEGLLYPTIFLPHEHLQWIAIDDMHARLEFEHNNLLLFFNVSFNEIGEIIEMESQRYMTKNRFETWVIQASAYQLVHHLNIPTQLEVMWRLKEGDFSYAQFDIKEVEYDLPEVF